MTAPAGPAGADPELALLLGAVRRALAEARRPADGAPGGEPAEPPAASRARPAGRAGEGDSTPPPAAKPGTASPRPLDLRRLFALGRRHRLVPHLCRELLRPGVAIGDEARKRVTTVQRRVARRALDQAAELARLTGELEQRGIEALALKGSELAMELFGDVTLRWSRDLDILVRRRDVSLAAEVLVALGYEWDLPAGFRLESRLGRAWVAHGAGQLELRHPERKMLVELHWKLAHPRIELPLSEELLFSATRAVALGAQVSTGYERVRTLAWPALLVYLCHHGSRHRWRRLHWLIDVAALMDARGEDDWRRADALAAAAGVGPAVGLAVVLAEQLLQVPIPPPIAERASWLARGRRLAAEILPAILDPAFDSVRFESVLARQRWGLALQTRWRHRLRPGFWLWPLALTKSDLDWPGYPDALAPLLYLARPLRSIARRMRGADASTHSGL